MPNILNEPTIGPQQKEYARRISVGDVPFSALTHLERAAFHIYESIKPQDGLSFDELSSEQRNAIRLRVLDARDATDLRMARSDDIHTDELINTLKAVLLLLDEAGSSNVEHRLREVAEVAIAKAEVERRR